MKVTNTFIPCERITFNEAYSNPTPSTRMNEGRILNAKRKELIKLTKINNFLKKH